MSKKIKTEAAELLELCESDDLSSEGIDAILSNHEACFDGDLCEICRYLEDYDDGGEAEILFNLAGNPNTSPEQQLKIIDFGFKWQGRSYGILLSLASNPNVSDRVKKESVLSAGDLTSWFDDFSFEEDVRLLYEYIEDNPRFSKSERSVFVQEVLDEWGIDLTTEPDYEDEED